MVKNPLVVQYVDSIPGSGRFPGEGNGNPVQYSSLENLRDRGDWRATVHEVTKIRHNLATTQQNNKSII